MPNMNLSNAEMVYLSNAIMSKYCGSTNQKIDTFKLNLTGYIRHYELICDDIMKEIKEPEKVLAYLNLIGDSTLKVSLKTWVDAKEKNSKYKDLPESPWASANILRKLIFYGPKETGCAFKESFILACYIYSGVDRNGVAEKININLVGETILPQNYIPALNNNLFPKNRVCKLVPIGDKKSQEGNLQFEFNGEPINLNRLNLAPENNTITSKIQASIFIKDGEWYLNNLSELKTTYIQVTKPTKVEKGDIIVFGNKYFLFDE